MKVDDRLRRASAHLHSQLSTIRVPLMPEAMRRHTHGRQWSAYTAFTVAFLVVIGVGVITGGLLLERRYDSDGVFPPPSPGHWGFTPTPAVDGNLATVEATFSDGESIYVTYPYRWRLADHGWRPATGLILELEDQTRDGTGYLFAGMHFFHVGEGGELPPELLAGMVPEIPIVVTMEQGNWTAAILFGKEWDEDSRTVALDSVALAEQPNGFITVTTTDPLRHFSDDVEQRSFADTTDGATILVGDVMWLTSGCSGASVTSGPESITWCDMSAGIGVNIRAPRRLHATIYSGLQIQRP